MLAGGIGSRLGAITAGTLPKALVPVLGRPFIDYKLRSLAQQGVDHVVLSVGLGGDQIAAHVGDGSSLGIHVDYVFDGPTLLGTGGAIRRALPSLPDWFWVTYGDSVVWADLPAVELAVKSADAEGAMTVLENDNSWGPSNVTVHDGLVTGYAKDSAPESAKWIDYGLLYLGADLFRSTAPTDVVDLQPILQGSVSRRALLAIPVHERFWEIGTPEALSDTERHFNEVGMWERLR
ncbi:MAG: NTP transferase domain-containing protein [Ilumatobacteraceae bacterium]